MTDQLTTPKLSVQRNFVKFSKIHFHFVAIEYGCFNTRQDHLAIAIYVDT